MKIIVASTIVPFVSGGGNQIVEWLVQKLREYGHETEMVMLPHYGVEDKYMSQALGMRMYHLEDYCDRLISIRVPSYLLQHPDKRLWFIHHHRTFYDMWNTRFNPLDTWSQDALALRKLVMNSDYNALMQASKIFTNSLEITGRLKTFNNIDSEVLYPPLLDDSQFRCDEYGDYVYYSSRVCGHKRQHLAVEAMKYTKTPVKLVLSGVPESPDYSKKIKNIINRDGTEKKVKLHLEWVTDEEKVNFFANCLAAIYIPVDEDSYGYPSLEAAHSRKAVISCKDSGGTDEFIVDGYNGFLAEPTPEALAEIFDRLYMDKHYAETLGDNSFKQLDNLNISWDHVIGSFVK